MRHPRGGWGVLERDSLSSSQGEEARGIVFRPARLGGARNVRCRMLSTEAMVFAATSFCVGAA